MAARRSVGLTLLAWAVLYAGAALAVVSLLTPLPRTEAFGFYGFLVAGNELKAIGLLVGLAAVATGYGLAKRHPAGLVAYLAGTALGMVGSLLQAVAATSLAALAFALLDALLLAFVWSRRGEFPLDRSTS